MGDEIVRRGTQNPIQDVRRIGKLPLFQQTLAQQPVHSQILWIIIQNVAAMSDGFQIVLSRQHLLNLTDIVA